MTEKDKQLLLKDLCGRLPYITFVYVEWHETERLEICVSCEDDEEEPNIHTLISCDYYGECVLDDDLYKTIYDIKPYLRPMSSMTDAEKRDYQYITERWMYDTSYYISDSIDWLNAHHFDYRGLIGKGLALEAPDGIYK